MYIFSLWPFKGSQKCDVAQLEFEFDTLAHFYNQSMCCWKCKHCQDEGEQLKWEAACTSVANISNNLTIQKPLAVYAENMELYPLDLYGQIKHLLFIHRKTRSVTMTMQLFLLQVSELAIYICLRPTHTRVFFCSFPLYISLQEVNMSCIIQLPVCVPEIQYVE